MDIIKKITKSMRFFDFINLFSLGIFYYFIQTDIKELNITGLLGFAGIFLLYVINIIFRNAIIASSELIQERKRLKEIDDVLEEYREKRRVRNNLLKSNTQQGRKLRRIERIRAKRDLKLNV